MKTTSIAALALTLAGILSAGGARADGHYVPGVEGIQAASVPPPGMYYLGYLINYDIGSFRAPGSSTRLPGHNTGTVTALANRVVWISGHRLLGADYGMEAIVPVIRTSLTVNAAGISDSRSGVGDIYVGPLVLGWHGQQWDAVAAAGMWLDTASTSHPASAGKGFKSAMLTGGATWYFDAARSISGSALVRFERNGHNSAGLRPGSQVTMEWGLARNFGAVQAGLVGYSQWQVSSDSGAGTGGQRSSRHAAGAELVYPIPGAGMFLKAAAYKEARARAGTGAYPKGSLLRFTLVKAF
ncbi:transporter [Diaphorobacter ruginosibacter]|uniref:SphA family protein n=1 Tax=Diaphorobacter ruginosibacter TaxID=1715720 RepID=UPI003341768A